MCSELLACPLCCISKFPDIESFKLNLIKVNSKPIKCPLCDEVLLGLDKLTIHLFGHSLPNDTNENKLPQETPSPTLSTQTVKKVTTTRAARGGSSSKSKFVITSKLSTKHVHNTDISNSHKCEICGFVFVDKNLLDLHLNLVHNFTVNERQEMHYNDNDESKKYQCHLCMKCFKMKGALRIHIKVAHVGFHDNNQRINICDYLKTQKSVTSQNPIKIEAPYSPQRTENFYQQQSSSFSASSSPASYVVPSPQCSSSGEQKSLDGKKSITDSPSKSTKSWPCDVCEKMFTTKYFLKKHKRLHTGEMPYKCDICAKLFHFQQSYHKHLLYHSDQKPYSCNECGRAFKELSTLHNHERIHSGVKPYGCEICGKFFRQRVSYLVHQRIHNGSLPYKCTECGKCFRYKVSQRSHKCSGVLVKQPGELIQKLMQNSLILPQSTVTTNATTTSTTTAATEATTDTLTINNVGNSNNNNNNCIDSITNNENINVNANVLEQAGDELCLDDFLNQIVYSTADDVSEKLSKSNTSNEFIPQQSNSNNHNNNNTNHTYEHNNNNNDSAFNEILINTTNIFNANTIESHTNSLSMNLNYTHHLETINEESIKELLYGSVS